MNINGLQWKVSLTNDFGEDLFGRTDYDSLTIWVNAKICKQQRNASLRHELVHAFLHSYGFMFKDDFTREDICEFVSHNLETLSALYEIALEELK